MFAIVLLPPNTNRFQQVEDYIRGWTTSTKYWPLSTSWRLCQRLFHYYPNTDRFQHVEDYVRGCTTSTKYWLLSTSWRLCPRLYYIYQILTTFNKLKIMSEVVLLLPTTDRFQQVEDYVRDCITSTKYWPLSTSWRLCRGCTTSTKYWPLSTSWRLCPRLYYFYQILIAFNKWKIMSEAVLLLPNIDHFQQIEDYVRSCTTSSKYWPLSTSWRLCPRLYYFYQIPTTFNKLKFISEAVLLLPITNRFQQVEDYVRGCTASTKYSSLSTSGRLCPRLYYFYQILISFNKLKIMSEVVLLLPNTDRFQQVEDYVRGCTTSTKYRPLSTSWSLYPRLYYFYQLLIAFNKLKIMSEVVLLLPITNRFQQVEDYVRGYTPSTNY
jgi:uncharacterized protein (DUF1499 family)